MKNKFLYFLITFFLISFYLKAQENKITIPVIKSPYPITSQQWDEKGENFSYTTNGKIYVRDFSTLSLKDSFTTDSELKENLFSSVNSKKVFPDVTVSISNDKVILNTQKNASSQIQTKEIVTPVTLKAVDINKNQDKLACIGYDDNAFIYDINNDSVIFKIPHNAFCKDIKFLDDDKFLYCDSNKTVSLFSSSGQKLKTFTNANNISGFSISPENENLVIYDDKGILNFYSIADGKQYGYSPKITSSNIQDISFSNDSKKILIKTNNSLYTTKVSDILYAQNTIAPSIKELPISYQLELTKNDNVTEFNNDNIKNFVQDTNAEYITKTQEKDDDAHSFSMNERKTPDEQIAIIPFKEQEEFPSTVENPAENSGKIYYSNETANLKESDYTPLSQKQTNVITTGGGSENNIERNISGVNESAGNAGTIRVSRGNGTSAGGSENRSLEKSGDGNSSAGIAESGSGSTGVSNTESTNIENTTSLAKAVESDNEIENQSSVKNTKTQNKQNNENQKQVKTEEKTDTKQNDEKSKEKDDKNKKVMDKWKSIKEYNDENIKTLFKDGHGLMFNFGVCKTEGLFPLSLILPMGYKNYDLLRPFYFGGTLELDFSFPSSSFPYKYYDSIGEQMNSPFLVGFKLYAPIGACIYPLKNSFEVFGEFGLGIGFSGIWSGNVGNKMLLTKLYPAFFMNLRTGVAWDFINLTLNLSYDAVTGIAYGVELGAIINIGGTRTIGSMIERKNKKD